MWITPKCKKKTKSSRAFLYQLSSNRSSQLNPDSKAWLPDPASSHLPPTLQHENNDIHYTDTRSPFYRLKTTTGIHSSGISSCIHFRFLLCSKINRLISQRTCLVWKFPACSLKRESSQGVFMNLQILCDLTRTMCALECLWIGDECTLVCYVYHFLNCLSQTNMPLGPVMYVSVIVIKFQNCQQRFFSQRT